MDKPNFRYGSFLGSPDPVKGDLASGDSPADLIGYALDRVADDLLTSEQVEGALRFALDALLARDGR